jgi:Rrf2 family cysteine metabolism transcriptional repressor
MEGPLAPVECVSELNPDECKRADMCVTRIIWAKLRDSITEILDSYSLLDLANEYHSMPKTNIIEF